MIERRKLLAGSAITLAAPRFVFAAAPNDRVMVAYFTWYDNADQKKITKADIESEAKHSLDMDSGVSHADAVSAASLVTPGLISRVGHWIAEAVNAPSFSIWTPEKYPADFDACYDRAVDEKVKRYRPALSEETKRGMARLRNCEILFLCFPNWSYDLPAAVCAFAEQAGLAGKTVIPVCLHGTGGLANAVARLRGCAKGAKFRPTLSLYRIDAQFQKAKIQSWAKDALKAAGG